MPTPQPNIHPNTHPITHPILRVTNLTKAIDTRQILHEMSFEVQRGSIHAVLGKNGAGKTTLLKTLAGLYDPSGGHLSLNDPHEPRAFTYFVPDTIGFTRFEKLAEILDMHRFLFPNWDEAKFQNCLKTLEFDVKKRLHLLSKGEERQLLLSFALASCPRLYFLDEPFDGLDPQAHRQFSSWLIDDVISRDASVLISTHHLRDIPDFCDSMTLLHGGRLRVTGEIDAILGSLGVLQCYFQGEVDRQQVGFSLASDLGLASALQAPWSMVESYGNFAAIVSPREKIEELVSFVKTQDSGVTYEVAPLTLEQLFMYSAKEL